VSLPRRFHTPRGVRLAVRRLLANPGYGARARAAAEWCAGHDGAAAAAAELEAFAVRQQ
jgi:UDP:flavonoid glycosyltransferase YjiC (YdhE family)